MNICDCVKWSVIQIKDCSWDAVQAMLPLVSEQRREQALQYKHAFGQYACLKSYLMLQDLLREHYGIEGDLVFSYNEHGKPMLKEVSNIHFSISHCKEAIAVAVADRPVGIDVETLRMPSEALAEKVMDKGEKLRFDISDTPEDFFTALWTAKEAVMKCRGTGIVMEELPEILYKVRDEMIIEATRPYPNIVCTLCVSNK
ncbi:MAG: 4'-phosphopantetheinyl transferase superfamily protein [Bacteroidales bacterium]|nr:4'-phosphopantetheinyl transferase superfamily protein [Bacteroidales bacterium]